MGLDVKADQVLTLNKKEELPGLFKKKVFLEKHMVLGGGSNVLFKSDFDGLVILNRISGIEIISENEDEVIIKVGAGEVWHDLVMHCVNNGWGGIENLSLIPGTVGAAPMQNIGAYGVEIKEVFTELNAYDIENGEFKTFSNKECEFAYRSSVFKTHLKGKYIICEVSFSLSKKPIINSSYGAIQKTLEKKGISNPGIQDISQAVIEIRKSKLPDPAEIGNCGSFFKNPVVEKRLANNLGKKYPQMPRYPIDENHVKIPAGWLIEKAGWKGKKIGNTGSHKDQALVLVNYGNANGEEIAQLALDIQKDISIRFDILLEPEVNII